MIQKQLDFSEAKSLEAFAVEKSTNVAKIINFYGDNCEKDRLVSDKEMFLNLTSRSNVKVSNLREIVNFLRKNECMEYGAHS